MGEVLPLFPLGAVLLPRAPLQLRVFEPRYRALLADVTGAGGARRFGVVALTAGLEVDTALVRPNTEYAAVGTVAEILSVEPAEDGTSTLLAVGSQRFRLGRLVDGQAYVQAEVEFLDEPVGELPDTLPHGARALATEYQRLLAMLSLAEPERSPYPRDPVSLSYRIAVEAPLAPADLQALLAEETAAARLQHVVTVLRREVALIRHTRSVAVPTAVFTSTLRPN